MGENSKRSEHPKKHHFVPQFQLEYFADDRRRLAVHRLNREGPHLASVTDVGHRNLGHTLYRPGKEPDHVTLEKGMSEIEGAAASVIRELVGSSAREPNAEQREVLAWLIALQWQRHRLLLDLLHQYVRRDYSNDATTSEEELAFKSGGLRAILAQVIWPWRNRSDPHARPKDMWNSIASRLHGRSFHWKLLRPRTPSLVISDNTVCLSGVASGQVFELPPAYAQIGIGIGFDNFQRLTMPLTPRIGLIISRDSADLNRIDSRKFNRWTVGNSREFVAHHPDWDAVAPSLYGAVIGHLDEQRFLAKYIFPALTAGGMSDA
ncbi:DUF4238 domain-containing protein [Actinoplanes sp. DH11]|uniref:DUF4238 domain-containing protein n=1 Tax=Actinoplanes sp. DH11 TaxID=2857011 RepID=UPI001E64987B|nr:DUF4238 domain-containing protein [Actinoplanes sp. DH11]